MTKNMFDEDAVMQILEQGLADERNAILYLIDVLYDTQDPNPMYQDGYNHALDHIEEFVKGRLKT